jgi:hypothetical protein
MMSLPRQYRIALLVLLLDITNVQAQDATVVGTVVDESRAVLPGVTVTASSLTTGRQFSDVTSAGGEYRLVGVPAGRYKLQAELQGFAPTILPDVELLVGQNATITFTMKLASVSESVTVTGDTPLVDTRQAQVSGNIDRRQMEALPIPARNWLMMSTMVKGVTTNVIRGDWGSEGPVRAAIGYRVNLDGQEVTQESVAGYGQPGVSADAIAEYQIITNMFDITMGRSTQVQVQAISRAGTNAFAGGAYGFFRSDKFNAADAFTKKVLPYSNQQMGATLGGPIVRDKVHFFGSYEHTREPGSAVLGPASFGGQTITLPVGEYQHYVLGRGDYQMTEKDHLTARYSYYAWKHPQEFSAHPSGAATRTRDSNLMAVNWSRVISSSLLQEVKVNYFRFNFYHAPLASLPPTPQYIFPGLTIGAPWNYPEDWYQDHMTTRADWTWHKGSHDFKIGSELRLGKDWGWWEARSRGQMFFSRLPADVVRRFPLDVWNDPSRWDLSGLDALALRFDIYYAERGGQHAGRGNWSFDVPRPMFAGWIGDSWRVTDRFTLNTGVRYDVAWKDFIAPGVKETELVFDTGFSVENYGYRNNIRDLNNVAPRGGFAWNVTGNNDLILRGGAGLYYSTQGGNQVIDQQLWNGQRVFANSYVNDGRPGFVADPTRGVTAQDVLSGKVPLVPQSISVIAHDYQNPSKWQAMMGFQKQLTEVMAVDADLVYYRGFDEDVQRDPNVFYNPATGFPLNPTIYGRPARAFGEIKAKDSTGRSDYLGLASSFTRRYRNNFQLGVSSTVMVTKNDTGIGIVGYSNQQFNPFNLDQDWGRSQEFQRLTLNANGVWTLPKGFNLSGTYHYGSGNYTTITLPVDVLGLGYVRRVRSDLSIVPRNTFKEDPWNRVDVRVSKDLRLRGSLKLTGIAELFNAFNSGRFNRNSIEGSATYGQATSSGIAPRTGQLAFRLSF